MMMVVHVFKGDGRQPWFVRLVAANGRTLVVSEGYSRRWSAMRAARRMFPGLPIHEVPA